MLKEPFTHARNIFKTLESNGYDCFFVGGSVRDYLSNRSIGDIDIATNAKPEVMQKIFPKTVPVGIEHGTVLILDEGHSFEVTTYRTEGEYKDYRRPSTVSFVDDITVDLSRRDFTMNAIAMNFDGHIVDPFNGREDLNHGVIRTVREPSDRFEEDPLRMLRGVRFVSQLNFQMDLKVKKAIQLQHALLKNISVERIGDELTKMFLKPHINEAILAMEETSISTSLPIFNENPDIFDGLKQLNFQQPLRHAGMIFSLFHLLQPKISINDWVSTYKLSNAIKRKVNHLVYNYQLFREQGFSRTVLYEVGELDLKSFVELINLLEGQSFDYRSLENSYKQLSIHSKNDLVVSGQDLINWFPQHKKGKWVGEYLKDIEHLVIEGRLSNNYKAIESTVKQWKVQKEN